MKKLLTFALAATLTLSFGCTSSNDFNNGKQQLESMGYTQVENTGYNLWCCGEGDQYSTGFKAVDKSGKEVEGCFCSANFKGVTIRFE